MTIERRTQNLDAAKFSTQREVTYVLLGIFAAVVAAVLYQNDQSERSMVLQTVINLTLLAVGYWLGASKAAADQGQAMSRIAEAATPAAIVAVTPAPTNPETGNTPAAEVAGQPPGDKP
jgi:sulfite exporter TauE/SafE